LPFLAGFTTYARKTREQRRPQGTVPLGPSTAHLFGAGLLDQRLLYCGALRAFLSPAFFRSMARGSRVKNPAFFSVGRLASSSIPLSERAIPSRTAPAAGATAMNPHQDVKGTVKFEHLERLVHDLLVHAVRKIMR
jgi:hypothetical protein